MVILSEDLRRSLVLRIKAELCLRRWVGAQARLWVRSTTRVSCSLYLMSSRPRKLVWVRLVCRESYLLRCTSFRHWRCMITVKMASKKAFIELSLMKKQDQIQKRPSCQNIESSAAITRGVIFVSFLHSSQVKKPTILLTPIV